MTQPPMLRKVYDISTHKGFAAAQRYEARLRRIRRVVEIVLYTPGHILIYGDGYKKGVW